MEIEKQNFVAVNRLNPTSLKGFSTRVLKDVNENLHDVARAFMDFCTIQAVFLGIDNSMSRYAGEDPKLQLFLQWLELSHQAHVSSESLQINIFQELLKASEKPDETYEKVFDQIKSNDTKFSKFDKQTAIVLLINIFSRRLGRPGNQNSISVLLEVFIWGITEGILLNDGILLAYYYNNFINLCILAQRYALAEKYLEELKPLLNPQEREEAYVMGKASLLTAMNKPEELIRFLYNKTFSDPRYDVDSRIRIIQANYELEPEDDLWLLTQIQNLQKFVRNKKGLSEYIRKSHLTFLRYFKLLVKSSHQKDSDKLMQKLLASPAFPNKKWLIKALQKGQAYR